MLNRSGLFLLAIIAAVLVPYFLSEEQAGTRARVTQIWDKMFVDTVSDRYPAEPNPRREQYSRDPVSSASPVPSPRVSPYSDRSGRYRTEVPKWEHRPTGYEDTRRPSYRAPTRTVTRMPAYSGSPASTQDPLAPMRYRENPLDGIAPNQGATEWRTVSPQSTGLTTALPIPHTPMAGTAVHAGSMPIGVPDEEGWVTVGPAAGYGTGTNVGMPGQVASPIVMPGAAAGSYPGVPQGAEILPGIVVGGPGATGATGSGQRSAPVQDIGKLLNFDHAPGWVVDSWPRVSTHIVQSDLSGMRVPLVSGTDASALAGSLSYYFDRTQELQRISFEGATGDPTRLIELLREQYGLQAEPSLGGGMFVNRNEAEAQDSKAVDSISSVLRLRRAPIVRDSRPLQKYLVMLELNRPDSGRGISDEFARLLQMDQRSQRWTPAANPDENAPDPLDPSDPFSPLSPNDPRPTMSPTVPTAPAPLPKPPERGVIPSDNQFQSDRLFQNGSAATGTRMPPAASPTATPAAITPAAPTMPPNPNAIRPNAIRPNSLINPVRPTPPST